MPIPILGDQESPATTWLNGLVPDEDIEPDVYDSPDVGDHPDIVAAHMPDQVAVSEARDTARGTIPPKFKRQLRFKRVKPIHGRDVFAVERCLKRHGYRTRDPVFNYGQRAKKNVAAYQAAHKLTADGVYGPKTHSHLAPTFDGYEKWLYQHTVVIPPPPKADPDPVDRLMRGVWTLYALRPWYYHSYRPFRLYPWGTPISYAWDCSWFVTEVYYGAGLPDPNGIGYHGGSGNTESLRSHGTKVGVGNPGDLTFYGYYGSASDPAHVTMCVDNNKCIGFGSSGGPRLLYQSYRPIRETHRYV